MKILAFLAFTMAANGAVADVIVPVRNIRAREIIAAADLNVKQADVPGALTKLSDAAGLEARVALYAGRPLRPGDVGPPAIIGRNEIVVLIFRNGPLRIRTEGRALDRAASGDAVRVMNIASRTTVMGRVHPDGTIEVQ